MTGDDLKRRRQGLGISQERLAQILDVSTFTVSRWEQLRAQQLPNASLVDLALQWLESDIPLFSKVRPKKDEKKK